jgi:hypothetical protein
VFFVFNVWFLGCYIFANQFLPIGSVQVGVCFFWFIGRSDLFGFFSPFGDLVFPIYSG